MELTYTAEHVFRFVLDGSVAFRDRDVDMIRIEIMWVDAEPADDQPEGWWVQAELRGWPLTAKGTRDKRIKVRERIWAEKYPMSLWSVVGDAWTVAVQRSGIDKTQIVNPGEGLFDPAELDGVMEVHISTIDPEVIDAEAIAEAIENLNYFVGRVYVNDDLRWDFAEEELMGYPKNTKTEHAGAKHAKGFWGRKAEAKHVSKRLRRIESKRLSKEI